MTSRGVLLAPSLLLLAATGCEIDGWEFDAQGREREDFHYTYNLKAGGRLSLETFNGAVEIRGWDQDKVEIHGTKHAPTKDLLNAIKIDVVAAEDSVQVRAIRPAERRGNMGARFTLQVPRRVKLERIVSSNGSVRVENVEGESRLKTSNGAIRVAGCQGDLEATTSNASVELTGFKGGAVLRTSNGSISGSGLRGHFEATTSNAGIDASLENLDGSRPLKAYTSNGSIKLALAAPGDNDVDAKTSNSSITLRLPSSTRAQLKAHTSNSSISSEFDVTATGERSKTRLEGTIGGGGPRITLQTSNGSIKIAKLL